MRRPERACNPALAAVVVLALLLSCPSRALADGGPVLSDPQLWSLLKEGQQIAVVSLVRSDAVHVDLFISMLDESGESHEITYFLPLGQGSSAFQVEETTSLSFGGRYTQNLDATLRTTAQRDVSYRRGVRWSLILGTFFINGGWSWPIWLAWSLASCAPAATVAPIATFETPSSQVSIYGLDESTDLEALIQTTGLDPIVQETLARFRGQQIAVVKLRTQPAAAGTGDTAYAPQGQPGLHLAWTSTLVQQSEGPGYRYPLGTGSAWAHPIEQTRLYVVAPPEVDFAVAYPKLGDDLSGYSLGGWFGRSQPRIQAATGLAYAVEDAIGEWGRVWRVTYAHSNSDQDVVITRLPELTPQTRQALERPGRQRLFGRLSWALSFLVAVAAWLASWRLVMPRMLPDPARGGGWRTYAEALGWALLYPATNGIAAALVLVAAIVTSGLGLILGLPLLLVTVLGVVSIALFVRRYGRAKGTTGRTLATYAVIVLLANTMYLLFAVGYSLLLGVA